MGHTGAGLDRRGVMGNKELPKSLGRRRHQSRPRPQGLLQQADRGGVAAPEGDAGLRIVALLCGIIAGVLVFILPRQLGIDLLPSFLRLWKNSDTQQLVARLVFFASPAIAILGGFLALMIPNVAALLMLAAAVGWAGILLAVPQVFALPAAAPSGIALLGAILAYAAGEAMAARRRAERRRARSGVGRRYRDDDDYDESDDREVALRRDPPVVETRPPQRPKYEIPLTLEDAQGSRAMGGAPTLTATPQAAPAPQIQVPPMPAPQGRAPLEEPKNGRNRAGVAAKKSARAPSRIEDYDDDEDDEKRSRWPLFFVIFNGAAVVVLGIVVAVLFFGRGSLPFLGDASSSATKPAVEASSQPASPPSDGAQSSVAMGDVPTFSDALAYCNSVGTIDFPDRRYIGPQVPVEVTAALGIPQSSAPERVHWRCASGRLMACTSYGWPACDTTPTASEMLAFCKMNPDIPRLLAPNGTWSCEKGKPKLPADASWPVDERGFFPKAWVAVTPTSG